MNTKPIFKKPTVYNMDQTLAAVIKKTAVDLRTTGSNIMADAAKAFLKVDQAGLVSLLKPYLEPFKSANPPVAKISSDMFTFESLVDPEELKKAAGSLGWVPIPGYDGTMYQFDSSSKPSYGEVVRTQISLKEKEAFLNRIKV